MMNNQPESEDILQEAFTEAFINLDTFRYESSFGAWLKRIVVNRCINHMKKRKVDLYLTDNLKGNDYYEEEESERDYKLEVTRVQKAVELLPDGYRVILTLYLFEGYDHLEIAQILNISESTSKSQYLRAKKKVLDILKN
jgi:RNA polymerase sigma-70 factor (ECF subfamily)